ncbi:kinetochore protein NDC80 homolog [Sitodiplosis mosellana]|uniref:kinetochore protein NDC80 homolog n=1 Tax=Sitodiplosis mosellana TaxID=263140 RepID=UPI0024441C46|nr:kinetochore protein NDC80 homolog [Sitodiplosis mosellana]
MSEKRKLTYSDKKSYSTRKSNLPLSKNRLSNVGQGATLSRPSHIARPSSIGPRVVPPSSATRSSSATRLSRDTIGRSSGGLRRYGSDNYLNTPSRFSTMSTPLRGRSPAVRHSVMPPDSSRKSKHENIIKVQEILQRDESFYADLNLKNGCLKTMTINQFYMIIRRFVRLICGKDLDTFITGGDPINGILNFMDSVQYPFAVNKSMLKTPNAPHTFDQIVVMLLWLGSVSSVSTIASDDSILGKYLFVKDEQFPNEEYTSMFSKAIQDGYLLWNNESDEHSTFIDRLTDQLIAAKLDHKVETAAELQSLTDNLKIKSKELADNPVQLNNLHQFEQLESKYVEYETMEHDLENQLKDKRDRLAAVQVNWNDKRAKVQQAQSKIQALATQIQQQEHSIADYRKLAEKLSMMRTAVGTVQNEIKLIRDEESIQQITRARLLKKVSEAITKINHRGMQIVKVLNNTQFKFGEKELNLLHLPASPSVQLVQDVEQTLSHIFSVVKIQKHKTQIELDKATSKLNVLKAESEALTKEFDSIKKKYEKISFENEVLEKKSTMKNKKNENCTRKLTKQADEAKTKHSMLKVQIAAAHAKQKQLEDENIKLMEQAEAHAMKIIAEKQDLVNQLDELEKVLDGNLEGFDYPK